MKLPIQAQPVIRGVSTSKLALSQVIPQGCNWLNCAAKVASCAAQCLDSRSPSCLTCLGPVYNECKDCF